MDDVLKLTPHESVEVRSSGPGALEVEATWTAAEKPPPPHFHPEQDERFEVLAGTLHARVEGREHRLTTGDVLEIPRGASHQMWNEGDEPVRALWRTVPARRTREWFAALDSLQRSGRTGSNGLPSPLAFGVYLTEYRDVIRLSGPQPLVGLALRLLAVGGRLRGYSAEARRDA